MNEENLLGQSSFRKYVEHRFVKYRTNDRSNVGKGNKLQVF
jgi:hypothetical protein